MKLKIEMFISWCSVFLLIPSTALAQKLSNPLGENVTIEIVIARVIKALLGLSGAAALLMFVWGGFLWLTSAGDGTRVKNGKETVKWAILGLLMIFTAYILVNALIDALTKGTALDAPG